MDQACSVPSLGVGPTQTLACQISQMMPTTTHFAFSPITPKIRNHDIMEAFTRIVSHSDALLINYLHIDDYKRVKIFWISIFFYSQTSLCLFLYIFFFHQRDCGHFKLRRAMHTCIYHFSSFCYSNDKISIYSRVGIVQLIMPLVLLKKVILRTASYPSGKTAALIWLPDI